MSTPDAAHELLDKPGIYYEEDALQADTVRAAGQIAITAARISGQWGIYIFPANDIVSSEIPNSSPLLGSIVTDVEGMSEDPRNDRGKSLSREQVLPIAATWLADRGLEGQFESAEPLQGNIYENEAYMGVVLNVQARQ